MARSRIWRGRVYRCLLLACAGSISLHGRLPSHECIEAGRERSKRNRLRGFALESWSYNYNVTRTLPKVCVCEELHDPR